MNGSTRGFARFLCATAIAGTVLFGLVGCSADGKRTTVLQDNARKQGIKLYKDGNYVDAVGSFQNAVAKDPRDFKSFYYLGLSLDATTSYQQAIQAFRSSLDNLKWTQEGRIDKQFRANVQDGLAKAIAKSNSKETELAAMKAKGPESAEDVFVMAKVYRYTGDADSAVEAYQQASLMDVHNFYFQKDYGLYLEQLGQTQKAEVSLRKAYQMNPKDGQVADGLRRLGIVPGPTLLQSGSTYTPPVNTGSANAPRD